MTSKRNNEDACCPFTKLSLDPGLDILGFVGFSSQVRCVSKWFYHWHDLLFPCVPDPVVRNQFGKFVNRVLHNDMNETNFLLPSWNAYHGFERDPLSKWLRGGLDWYVALNLPQGLREPFFAFVGLLNAEEAGVQTNVSAYFDACLPPDREYMSRCAQVLKQKRNMVQLRRNAKRRRQLQRRNACVLPYMDPMFVKEFATIHTRRSDELLVFVDRVKENWHEFCKYRAMNSGSTIHIACRCCAHNNDERNSMARVLEAISVAGNVRMPLPWLAQFYELLSSSIGMKGKCLYHVCFSCCKVFRCKGKKIMHSSRYCSDECKEKSSMRRRVYDGVKTLMCEDEHLTPILCPSPS